MRNERLLCVMIFFGHLSLGEALFFKYLTFVLCLLLVGAVFLAISEKLQSRIFTILAGGGGSLALLVLSYFVFAG